MEKDIPQPNPVDTAREQLENALMGENINPVKIMTGLDKLEGALTQQGTRPIDIFTELTAHAIAAREAVKGDIILANSFNLRATNYDNTAQLLQRQEMATQAKQMTELTPSQAVTVTDVSQEAPKRGPGRPRTSKPTNTNTLPATNSAKR